MPLYEYQCQSCNKIFEILTFDYNKTQINCNCEKEAVCDRIISNQSKPLLTGTGFYQTDYKNK